MHFVNGRKKKVAFCCCWPWVIEKTYNPIATSAAAELCRFDWLPWLQKKLILHCSIHLKQSCRLEWFCCRGDTDGDGGGDDGWTIDWAYVLLDLFRYPTVPALSGSQSRASLPGACFARTRVCPRSHPATVQSVNSKNGGEQPCETDADGGCSTFTAINLQDPSRTSAMEKSFTFSHQSSWHNNSSGHQCFLRLPHFSSMKGKQKLEFSGIKKIWEHLLSYNQAKKCKTTIRNTSASSLASILSSSATQNSGISAAFDHQRHISTSLITLPSSQLCCQSLSENVMSSSGINLTFIPLENAGLETLLQTAEPRGSRRRRRRLFLGRRVCIAHIRLRTYYFCRYAAALLDLHRQSQLPPSFRGSGALFRILHLVWKLIISVRMPHS